MSLCIDIGFERFLYSKDPDQCLRYLDALVPLYASTLRDIVVADTPKKAKWISRARVCEATAKKPARWLDAKAAKPILEAVDAVYTAEGKSIDMSYGEAEPLSLQTLMFSFTKRPLNRTKVSVGASEVWASDISAIPKFGLRPGSHLTKLVALAKKHHLIVHSG